MQIQLLTWNIHGFSKIPNFKPEIKAETDILIISLQECFKIPEVTEISKDYSFYQSSSMLGLKTLVFSKKKVDIEFYFIGQGILGFLNKGAIVAIIDQKFSHVNVHLAAHEYNNHKRMAQIKEILSFSKLQKQLIFLTGDFNFRSKAQSDVFINNYPMFNEKEITFKPTYKYKNNELDSSRTPSYCDRIFYASIKKVEFKKYDSLQYVDFSDHKPVYGLIEIDLNSTVEQQTVEFIKRESLSFQRFRTKIYLFFINNVNLLIFAVAIYILKIIFIK